MGICPQWEIVRTKVEVLNFLESKNLLLLLQHGDNEMAISKEQGNETTIYSEKNVAAQHSSVLKDPFPRESIMMEGALEVEIQTAMAAPINRNSVSGWFCGFFPTR